jgi:predicted dehydrogenase
MAIDLTPEQRELGKANFNRAVGEMGMHRRGFMKGLLVGAAALPLTAAAYYGYNYAKLPNNKPVRTALIGAGDEGGVLVGEHNPACLEFVAFSDIRPTNRKRIFEDEKLTNPASPRRGFKHHYGADAEKKIRWEEDYHKLLEDDSIEAVVIALPLHLHAPVAIDALKAGKHVLCEKLMAWNITQCKDMIAAAEKADRVLSIGHQRHYSMLYAHAVEVLQSGVLGDVKHIRALWHRNNSWPKLDANGKPTGDLRDGWRPDIKSEDAKALAENIRKYGYKSMEELVRWRLYNRTGGGLMAELGSHQLDACSIFLGKVHPLAVSGVGGKFFYTDDREVDDHVFVTFEFPGPGYYADAERKTVKNKNDRVVVTYSSISTNQFEAYGECVTGSRGTMIVEAEQNVMLFAERDPNLKESGAPRGTTVSVSEVGKDKAALDASASTGGAVRASAEVKGKDALGSGPPSRGYREEMEHFAYCIRMWNEGASKTDRPQVRCPGKAAMADAIIALTANKAMRDHVRIEFKEAWFDPKAPEVPDPEMKPEIVTG